MARQAYAPTPLIRIVVQKENAGLFDARWFPARSLPAHFRCFPCGGLRRRTPGPPPFSSMNSTLAISKARRTAKSLAAVIDVSRSDNSARRSLSLMRLRGVIEQLKRPARLTIPIFAIQREQFTSCQMHGYPCACGRPDEGAFPPVCQSPAALNVARKAFED